MTESVNETIHLSGLIDEGLVLDSSKGAWTTIEVEEPAALTLKLLISVARIQSRYKGDQHFQYHNGERFCNSLKVNIIGI
jgi:hypothetical protein